MKFFYKYLKGINVDNIAVIGSKTALYCESLGIRVDFMPNDFSQEGFFKNHLIKLTKNTFAFE